MLSKLFNYHDIDCENYKKYNYAKNISHSVMKGIHEQDVKNVTNTFAISEFYGEGELLENYAGDGRTIEFIKNHFTNENLLVSGSRINLINIACRAADQKGIWAEFGVFQGGTANLISCYRENGILYEFDSFEGLPEQFDGMHIGTFSLHGDVPIFLYNVVPIKGWFEDTVPRAFGSNSEQISFLHIDCDLYSSAWTVFEGVAPFIRSGSVIVMDDFYNASINCENMMKCWQDYLAKYDVSADCIAMDKFRVAFKIR